MRIGFIEDTKLRGGTQIWVTEAVKLFINLGEEVNVIAPKDSYVSKRSHSLGAKIYTYDWDDIPKNKEKYNHSWTEGLSNSDVAVCTVHPPRENFHCSIYAAECIKEAGLKTILIPKTGTIVPEYIREFYCPEPAVKTQIICITGFTRNYLIDHYNIPSELVTLIYQGTEVDRFTSSPTTKQEAEKRYPLPKNAGPVLGSIGSFEERKGQKLLIDAVKKLSQTTLPEIHLLLVGEGPDENILKTKTKELGIEKNVSFFPFTDEPNYIFERLDALTLPSLYKEGLPNVLLEAMSMSVPCISTDIAGIPEIIRNEENGYLIKPGNTEELISTIKKFWENKENCTRMGKNARKLMEEKFDKKHQFFEFLNFFRSLI